MRKSEVKIRYINRALTYFREKKKPKHYLYTISALQNWFSNDMPGQNRKVLVQVFWRCKAPLLFDINQKNIFVQLFFHIFILKISCDNLHGWLLLLCTSSSMVINYLLTISHFVYRSYLTPIVPYEVFIWIKLHLR